MQDRQLSEAVVLEMVYREFNFSWIDRRKGKSECNVRPTLLDEVPSTPTHWLGVWWVEFGK